MGDIFLPETGGTVELELELELRRRRFRRVDLDGTHIEFQQVQPQRDPLIQNGIRFLTSISLSGPDFSFCQFRMTDGPLRELASLVSSYLELAPPAQRLEFVMGAPSASKKKRKRPRLELVPSGAPTSLQGDELAIYRQMTEGRK